MVEQSGLNYTTTAEGWKTEIENPLISRLNDHITLVATKLKVEKYSAKLLAYEELMLA
jgi:hypothetical protein